MTGGGELAWLTRERAAFLVLPVIHQVSDTGKPLRRAHVLSSRTFLVVVDNALAGLPYRKRSHAAAQEERC